MGLFELLFGVESKSKRRKDGLDHHNVFRRSDDGKMSWDSHPKTGDYKNGSGHHGGKNRKNKHWSLIDDNKYYNKNK
jgi:hypothetical protein